MSRTFLEGVAKKSFHNSGLEEDYVTQLLFWICFKGLQAAAKQRVLASP